jgi:hypothetical protein
MSFLMTFVVVGLTTMGLICIAAIIAEIVEMINNFKK